MTEREAMRLLQLTAGYSPDQLRRAYRDMVKVWHPDRFQADVTLRAKAESTLQSINDAYALLQGRGAAAAAGPHGEPQRAAGSQRTYASPTPPPAQAAGLPRYLVVAAAAGIALGVALAVLAIERLNRRAEPSAVSNAASAAELAATPAPGSAATAESTRPVARTPVDRARPESGRDVVRARGRGTGQVAARNASQWDAAVLLDGPAGARGFFVRRGKQVTLLDVAPGTYAVRVVFGATWTGRTFADGARFFQRDEPVRIVDRVESTDERPPLIVLDVRAGMGPVAAFELELSQ